MAEPSKKISFNPHFSDAARYRERLARMEAELAASRGENIKLCEKLASEQARCSALVNKLNSEAFKIKAASGCYTNCPLFKPKVSAAESVRHK